MKRCFIPRTFGKVKGCLCVVDESGKVYCSLVMGKSRVAPLKYRTIPRMEFQIFWTNSEAVLSYIRNQLGEFKVFVSNRVEIIRENSCDSQWFHVNTS